MGMELTADYDALREEMVNQVVYYATQIGQQTGCTELSEAVLDAMMNVPRHEFVPAKVQAMAYVDSPLPIGCGKTISQPYIVALMTDLLNVQKTDRVLEVGTGLGYQTAILARLSNTVFTVEIIEELARKAEQSLTTQGHHNINMGIGDGSLGWAEHAPFDKILVAAAPEMIPTSLLYQLKAGGRMVIPAGLEDTQQLMLVEKDVDGQLHSQEILHVRFSPLEDAE